MNEFARLAREAKVLGDAHGAVNEAVRSIRNEVDAMSREVPVNDSNHDFVNDVLYTIAAL